MLDILLPVAVFIVLIFGIEKAANWYIDHKLGPDWTEKRQFDRARAALKPPVNPTYGYWADEERRLTDEVDEYLGQTYYDFRPEEKRRDDAN